MTEEDKLKKALAKKFGISIAKTREVISLQDKFVAHVISQEADRDLCNFPSVRLPGFGLFYCPDKVKKNFEKVNKKK